FSYSQNINGIIVSDSNNLTVVKLWGTHQERGFAYGYLLGDKITNIVNGYILPIFGTHLDEARDIIIKGEDLVIDSIYFEESKALIAGMDSAGTNTAGIDYIDGLVYNSFLDLIKLLGIYSDTLGCSSLMDWGDATANTDLDGKSVISRHLDWSSYNVLINNQVMAIYLPSELDEQPWIMIGFAGQMSVLSGLNSQVAVFQHMMSDFNGSTSHNMGYEPIWFTLRKAIEKKDFNNDGHNNVQDIRDAIVQNVNGFADGYIVAALASATTGADSLTALVAELAPMPPLITFRSNSYPDNIPGDNLYAANYEIKRNNHQHYCGRYNSVVNAIGDGINISSLENWNIMRDHSNSSSSNLQFMQVIPELGILNLSVHHNGNPAYQHEPVSYDIYELFSPISAIDQPLNNSNLPNIILTPNPAQTFLKIQANFDLHDSEYDIYNVNGERICKGELNKLTNQISIKHLNDGIYLLKLNSKRYSFTNKFVKKSN
ncbi:MAG: T9SS type A sorting domain-containing protein, partial [Bacteroidales bacterium]|nr:T9SS type A sorting domain-containing protein [Bacteroidales bacterium]